MNIPVQRFTSGTPGIRLVVFGAIHGNEPCGPRAMERIAARIGNGDIVLRSGSLLLVPGANPEAFARRVRQTEENLNRVFRKTSTPQSYEARVANELCALLDSEADILVDIHSTSAPGPMSVFTDYPTEKNLTLAKAIGPEYVILDWPIVYANNPHGLSSSCTSDYAQEIGIPSATVECGQHEESAALGRAESAIMRALAYADIIESREEQLPSPRMVRMVSVEKKYAPGDTFTRQWGHLEPIVKGTPIATLESGDVVVAEQDCMMILPKHHAAPGEEWYYLGVVE